MTAASLHNKTEKTEKPKSVCLYCEKPVHFFRDCRKRIKKQQEQRIEPLVQNVRPSTFVTFAPSPHCHRRNIPPANCWNGPNAADRTKDFKQKPPPDITQEGQD